MPYLFAAFCAIWVVLFLYLLSLSRRQRELSREVEALRQMMERGESPTVIACQ
jgi:CcmD family protein